jgi:hypothetical protein
MKALKSARTLAASLGVLAAGALAAGPAMAFDVVDWNWYKNKYQTEWINVDIDVDIESTGLVEIEKLQIFFGNSVAVANTHDVINTQFDSGGNWRDVYYSCYCYGKVWVPNALDAQWHLPEVTTAASAFGNLQVITSDVPVFLHDAQFVANDSSYSDTYGYSNFASMVASAGYGYGNIHTDLAKAFTVGTVYNLLTPANIGAYANTTWIVNATVDNTATAAANLIQVNLESDVDGMGQYATTSCMYGYCDTDRLSNHVVQADITQFAYANVGAVANVQGVYVDNYSNLAKIDRSLVNNVATSIGNGVIVNVGPVPVPAP